MIYKNDFPEIKWVLGEYGEFPSFYSDNACRIISSKYFTKGETTLWDMVYRVVHAIGQKGDELGYFKDSGELRRFQLDLAHILINQEASFNSPVWFNVGVEEHPQCSACFIQSVEDNMDSILQLMTNEGKLFKYGSGTGTNLSPLRAKGAPLSNGGSSSGPVEFRKMFDAGAGVIKSGGKTRRAAKMVLMDCDHPDVLEFVQCKAKEEAKVKRLVEMGVPVEEAYEGAQFQNGNNSVRLSDKFMANVSEGTPEDELLTAIAQAAWECGDPGVQFSDTIQDDMPSGLVCNASNPCSEYLFINESACNLASINIGRIHQIGDIKRVTTTMITAMDIIVSLSSYPTKEIADNSEKYRPLGLGITNVGAYLMSNGLAYDSDGAREEIASIMRAIHGYAEDTSHWLGIKLGIKWSGAYPGSIHPLRNAQLTLIAPTGTISFMMDCESTGIEPVFAQEQTKYLVGGGTMTIKPECVQKAYDAKNIHAIQTAIPGELGTVLSVEGHLKMMAAVQPHLSGAISKTVNLPSSATVEDIKNVYIKAWDMGLKCIAVYRDGCKAHQPLVGKAQVQPASAVDSCVSRARLPYTRKSVTHKFTVGGTSGYFTVGLYEDGTPGEIFVNISKEGSTMGGLMDAWATSISMGLQYGVPLAKFTRKFRGSRFEPSGFCTGDINTATSIIDYICQWLDTAFGMQQDGQDKHGTGDGPDLAGSTSGETCPDCGMPTVRTGTCHTCGHCGWNGGCG